MTHDLQRPKLTRSCAGSIFIAVRIKARLSTVLIHGEACRFICKRAGCYGGTGLSGLRITCRWPQTVYGPEVLGCGRSFFKRSMGKSK